MNEYRRMGDWLVQGGMLTTEQLEHAVSLQRQTKMRFGEVLVKSGLASEESILACLAAQYDMPIADLKKVRSRADARQMVTASFALAHLLLPVKVDDKVFECIMADPVDLPGIDDLRRAVGRRLVISLAPPTPLHAMIVRAYRVPKAPKLTVVTPQAPSKRRKAAVLQTDRFQLLEALAEANS